MFFWSGHTWGRHDFQTVPTLNHNLRYIHTRHLDPCGALMNSSAACPELPVLQETSYPS